MPQPTAKKRILYLFDDVNYPSGARNATALQAKALQGIFDVSLLSVREAGPEAQALFDGIPFLAVPALHQLDSLHHPLGQVLLGKNFPARQKIYKLRQASAILTNQQGAFNLKLFGGPLIPVMDSYDIVVVVSEASMLRPLAARLQKAKKVQWIHTDYARWRSHSLWARRVTRHDAELYAHFDAIVTLSTHCQNSFSQLFPTLATKNHSIRNLIDAVGIRQRATENQPAQAPLAAFNLITIGRMEAEKNLDALIDTAALLAQEYRDFHWYLVGGGRLLPHIQKRVRTQGLAGVVVPTGPLQNPYPLLAACHIMVLLSHYEGTPVTIDEAAALGVPVLATCVGGVPQQIAHKQNGLLLAPGPDLPQRAAATLAQMIQHPQQLQLLRQSTIDISAQNQATLAQLEQLFSSL